ncbi:MAG: SHOCT domain-containing protein [Phycisphaerales bacterium]|nr:SHOCT domain-containing protein [Phycisphaerales bacterium]
MSAPAAEPLSHFVRLAPVLGALVLIVIAGAVALLLIKRWWKGESEAATPGFTLGDLRAMRDSGEISVAEYERAKEQMVRKVRTHATSAKAVKGQRGTTR